APYRGPPAFRRGCITSASTHAASCMSHRTCTFSTQSAPPLQVPPCRRDAGGPRYGAAGQLLPCVFGAGGARNGHYVLVPTLVDGEHRGDTEGGSMARQKKFGTGMEEREEPGPDDGFAYVGTQKVAIELIQRCIRVGQHQRDLCDANHPPTSPNYLA